MACPALVALSVMQRTLSDGVIIVMLKKILFIGFLFLLVLPIIAAEPWGSHQQTLLKQDVSHPVLLPGSFAIYRGKVYLIDTKAADVKIFKTDGAFVSVFGRKGPGPGEFAMPRFSYLHGDHLLIKDSRRRQLVTYDLVQFPPKLLQIDKDMMPTNAFVPLRDDLLLLGGRVFLDDDFCSLFTYDRTHEKVREKYLLMRDWCQELNGLISIKDMDAKLMSEGISSFVQLVINDEYIFFAPAARQIVFCINRQSGKRVKFGEKSKLFLPFYGDRNRLLKLGSDQTGSSRSEWLKMKSQISQVYQAFILENDRLGLVYSHYNTQRDALDFYLQLYTFSGKLLSDQLMLSAKADNSEAIVFHYQKEKKQLWVLDTDESDEEGETISILHTFLFQP